MEIVPFETERFFAEHEFTAPHLLCASDCETLSIDELLEIAGTDHRALGDLRLGYTDTRGALDLRERIAGLYEGVDPEEVVGLSSPEEGIFIAMHALLEPGDEVVVVSPCYDSLHNLAAHLGCAVVRWPVVESDEPPGGWRLDLDSLREHLERRPKLVIVNFPHNPTGVLPTVEEWRTIVREVERSGAWLFCDEMYRGLEYKREARLASGCEVGSRTLTLSGLSKTYGLPGLRSGWLAVHDSALRERLFGWKDYTSICASAPSERLGTIALGVAEKLARRCRSIVMENLRLADTLFARHAELLRWNRPRAGSVALVGLRGERSARGFCETALERQGVLLLPGECLGSDDRHFRVGFGRAGFAASLARFGEFLESAG